MPLGRRCFINLYKTSIEGGNFQQNVSWKRCLKQKSPFFEFFALREAFFFSWFWGTHTTRNHVLRGTFTTPLLAYPSFAHFGFFFCTLAFDLYFLAFVFFPFSFVGDLIRPSATNRSFSSFHNIGLEGIAPILAKGRINVNTYLKKIFALLFIVRVCAILFLKTLL